MIFDSDEEYFKENIYNIIMDEIDCEGRLPVESDARRCATRIWKLIDELL